VANMKKKGLGKGLSALIGPHPISLEELGREAPPEAAAQIAADGTQLLYLDPTEIEPNPKQPRRDFNEEALSELAESMKRDGLQEPVLVRRRGEKYQLVSGERRVRAAVMADLTRIPALCREVSDRDMLRLGLIENIQREDLNPIELARGYQDLIDEFHWTQEELAAEVGKKRVTVTNTLRLLNLPEVIQEQIVDGSLSTGHAKALLALATPEAQRAAARKIIAQGLSVRQAEKLASTAKPSAPKKPVPKDPNVALIEDDLRRSLGTKVVRTPQKSGGGKIEIEYFNLDELDRILSVLRGKR